MTALYGSYTLQVLPGYIRCPTCKGTGTVWVQPKGFLGLIFGKMELESCFECEGNGVNKMKYGGTTRKWDL